MRAFQVVDEGTGRVEHAMQRALQRRMRGKEVERAFFGERTVAVATVRELHLHLLKGHLCFVLVVVEERRRWIVGEGCEQVDCGGSMALFEE